MKQRLWNKVKKSPPEKQCVYLFVDYGNGAYNVFSGHQEAKVWFIYDPFTEQFRIFRKQQLVTHWRTMDDLPIEVKRKHAPNIELNLKNN